MKKVVFLLSGLLAGCAENPYDPVQTPIRESLYQFPASSSPVLTETDTAGLDQWLNTLPASTVKMAFIEPGSSYEPARTEALQRHLTQRSFAADSIRLVNAEEPHPTLAVRVRYRVYPTLAECAVWHSEGDWNELNAITGRMGCSSSNNLRAMVANKNDLLVPNSDPHAENETAVRAIGIYNSSMPATVVETGSESDESQTTDE